MLLFQVMHILCPHMSDVDLHHLCELADSNQVWFCSYVFFCRILFPSQDGRVNYDEFRGVLENNDAMHADFHIFLSPLNF